MRSLIIFRKLVLILPLVFFSNFSFGQLNMTVNSLADDEYSYAWDNPDTPEDESMDGICKDEMGRCTLTAAISEASNMGSPVNISFNVEGTINLINTVYLEDGSFIDGGGKIALKNDYECLQINNSTTVYGLTFKDALVGLSVNGDLNIIGNKDHGNTFINCSTGIIINGDENTFYSNNIGLDQLDVIQPNDFGIMINGSYNSIGNDTDLLYGNNICASSYTGIYIAYGGSNIISGNNIGTNNWGDIGYGNQQGIFIAGSSLNDITSNTIVGNQEYGIFVGAAPPETYSPSNNISNNFIGIDPLGKIIPNGDGIVVTNGAVYTEIDNNYIAGNIQNGISIFAYDDISITRKTVITGNFIGLNSFNEVTPNNIGISILGNVHSVVVGSDEDGIYNNPNFIVGNTNLGIAVTSEYGFSPDSIVFRKNIVKKNGTANVALGTSCNSGIQPPYGLSFSENTIAGIHDIPNVLIDIYKADINEFPPSAYQWLGSTTADANGVFSFEIYDPSIEAVSITATTSAGNTSGFSYLEIISGVDENIDQNNTGFYLGKNYPNPFIRATTIEYNIPDFSLFSSSSKKTILKVYDVLQREVATLVDTEQNSGHYQVEFNGEGLQSGIYYCRLAVGQLSQTRKIILLK